MICRESSFICHSYYYGVKEHDEYHADNGQDKPGDGKPARLLEGTDEREQEG